VANRSMPRRGWGIVELTCDAALSRQSCGSRLVYVDRETRRLLGVQIFEKHERHHKDGRGEHELDSHAH
jgi:hypothetical protein